MKDQDQSQRLSRRDFLKLAAAAAGGLALASLPGCATLPTATEPKKENEPAPTAFVGGISTLVVPPTPTTGASIVPEMPPTPTLETQPSPTPPVSEYPADSSRFLPFIENPADSELPLDEVIRKQSNEAEAKLLALGIGDYINEVKGVYVDEIVRKRGVDRDTAARSVEWYFSLNEPAQTWAVVPRDIESQQIYMPVLTDTQCGTGREISGQLAAVLGIESCEGDFFDLQLVDHPGGLGDTRQVLRKDSSGWFVYGETAKNPLTWYDMKKEASQSWTPELTFRPQEATEVKKVEVTDVQTGAVSVQWRATGKQPGMEWVFNTGTQEWVTSLPEGVAFLEEHNGDMYGISPDGEAVVKLNNQSSEWEHFTRPVKQVKHNWLELDNINVPIDVSNELERDNISRLVDNEGNSTPYGYLFEWQPSQNEPDFTHVFISGYSRGAFRVQKSSYDAYFMMFEVPFRYERQLLPIIMINQSDTNTNVWRILDSRNIEASGINLDVTQNKKIFVEGERESVLSNDNRSNMNHNDLAKAMSDPLATGRQIVLSLQLGPSKFDSPEDPLFVNQKTLRDNLRNNQALSDHPTMVQSSYIWVPQDLAEKYDSLH